MKTEATQPLPRAHRKRVNDIEKRVAGGQGPGETPTPKGVQSYVKDLTKHVKPS